MKLRFRKNKDGSRTYFVDLTHNGQRRRIRLIGIHDREAAEVAFSDFRVKYSRGQADLPTDDSMPLERCLREYLAAKEGAGCLKSHMSILEARAEQAMEFLGRDLSVRHLTERLVNDWRRDLLTPKVRPKRGDEALIARGKKIKRQPHADTPETVNRKVRFLCAALDYAVRQNKIGKNPIKHIASLSDHRREVWRMLTVEETAALLGVLKDGLQKDCKRKKRGTYKRIVGRSPDLYVLVLFLLSTGARVGEALALRWQDVDFERGFVTLHTTKRAAKGRRASVRHIPMNDVLRELLEGLPKEGVRVLQISHNNIRRKFEHACRLAKIGDCRIHDLRHTFASHLVMAGKDLNTVRELLGHTTLTMTLRYAHLAPEKAKDAVDALPFEPPRGAARVVSIAN